MSSVAMMEALFARVAELPDAPPIAWPNLPFPGVDAEGRPAPLPPAYLRVQFLPNRTRSPFIGSTDTDQHRGMLQVSVVSLLGEGEAHARHAADAVVAHFPARLRLPRCGVAVRVTRTPAVGAIVRDDGRAMIPVTIEWECLA